MSRRRLRCSFLVGIVAALVLSAAATSCTSEAPAQHLKYVIPEGTAGLIATNRAPVIFPPNLVVHVGDSVTIRNDDNFVQEVGPYIVPPKSTITQHYTSPGVLEGNCKMSAGGNLSVTVLARA